MDGREEQLCCHWTRSSPQLSFHYEAHEDLPNDLIEVPPVALQSFMLGDKDTLEGSRETTVGVQQ